MLILEKTIFELKRNGIIMSEEKLFTEMTTEEVNNYIIEHKTIKEYSDYKYNELLLRVVSLMEMSPKLVTETVFVKSLDGERLNTNIKVEALIAYTSEKEKQKLNGLTESQIIDLGERFNRGDGTYVSRNELLQLKDYRLEQIFDEALFYQEDPKILFVYAIDTKKYVGTGISFESLRRVLKLAGIGLFTDTTDQINVNF